MGDIRSNSNVGQYLFRREPEFSSYHCDTQTFVFQQTNVGDSRKDHIIVQRYRILLVARFVSLALNRPSASYLLNGSPRLRLCAQLPVYVHRLKPQTMVQFRPS